MVHFFQEGIAEIFEVPQPKREKKSSVNILERFVKIIMCYFITITHIYFFEIFFIHAFCTEYIHFYLSSAKEPQDPRKSVKVYVKILFYKTAYFFYSCDPNGRNFSIVFSGFWKIFKKNQNISSFHFFIFPYIYIGYHLSQ